MTTSETSGTPAASPEYDSAGRRHARKGGQQPGKPRSRHGESEDFRRAARKEAQKLLAQGEAETMRALTRYAITDELVDVVVEKVLEGNYPSSAAKAFGVSPSTFNSWLKKGEEIATHIAEMDDDEQIATFLYEMGDPAGLTVKLWARVSQADGEWEVTTVSDAFSRRFHSFEWKGPMTILERRKPELWAKREVKDGGFESFENNVRKLLARAK